MDANETTHILKKILTVIQTTSMATNSRLEKLETQLAQISAAQASLGNSIRELQDTTGKGFFRHNQIEMQVSNLSASLSAVKEDMCDMREIQSTAATRDELENGLFSLGEGLEVVHAHRHEEMSSKIDKLLFATHGSKRVCLSGRPDVDADHPVTETSQPDSAEHVDDVSETNEDSGSRRAPRLHALSTLNDTHFIAIPTGLKLCFGDQHGNPVPIRDVPAALQQMAYYEADRLNLQVFPSTGRRKGFGERFCYRRAAAGKKATDVQRTSACTSCVGKNALCFFFDSVDTVQFRHRADVGGLSWRH